MVNTFENPEFKFLNKCCIQETSKPVNVDDDPAVPVLDKGQLEVCCIKIYCNLEITENNLV